MNKVDKVMEEAKRLVKLFKSTKKKYINLVINHEPKKYAMKRPRVGKFGQMYVPDAKGNKQLIRKAIQGQYQLDELIKYPIKIEINFFTKIPNDFNKIETLLAVKKYIRPITKPDIDNMEKTYLDALTDVIWQDDNQIIDVHTRKFYALKPKVEIKIEYRPILLSKKQDKKGTK